MSNFSRKWKSSKTAVRKWLEKKDELENDDNIIASKSSAYFEVRGVNYRISGHSPEAAANHIEKTNRDIGFTMSDEEIDARLDKAEQTRRSAQSRGRNEVQIWAAQTKAIEIRNEIENRTFDFANQRYFNRDESMEILTSKGEVNYETLRI